MARYSYRAVDGAGRRACGKCEAAHLSDLELRLKRMGLDLINAHPVRARLVPLRRIKRRELIKFCIHLEQLTRAGVPIIEALADLRDSLLNARLRLVTGSIVASIEGGSNLSQAMARHPGVFDRVFVSLIAAAEASGKLPEILHGLAEALKWQDELAAQSKKLLLYPALIGTVLLLATGFVAIYLLPRMAQFVQGMGHPLPRSTRFLLDAAQIVQDDWVALLLLPALLTLAAQLLLKRSAKARQVMDRCKLALPFFGNVLRKIALSRFAATFAMMYASGISILDALRNGEAVAGNAVIRGGLNRVGRLIGEGQSLTAAFSQTGLFPPLVIRMLRVGESSGGIDTALANVSYFYDRDVREAIQRLQTMVEPLLTLLLGVILGGVFVAAFAPLYDIIAGLS